MKKIKQHIEIVRSSRGDLVSLGESTTQSIYSVLSRHYQKVGVSIVNNMEDFDALVRKQPDLVFLGTKFLPDTDEDQRQWVSTLLKDLGINHTGSQQAAIELECNKALAKQHIEDAGLSTARSVVGTINKPVATKSLGLNFPLFVKPSTLGGGLGIDSDSVVNNLPELKAKIKQLHKLFSPDILVEEYLSGREFSVAMLRDDTDNSLLAMPVEIISELNKQGLRILDHATKNDPTLERVVRIDDTKLHTLVSEFAKDVFIALGARDYGRIDVRFDSKGFPNFLEANLVPGLSTDYGYFAQACRVDAGISYEDMILCITNLGFRPELADFENDFAPDLLLPENLVTAF